MNIQIYAAKKNPDVLKAERFFKERRISYQMMDLKKHKLGRRELELFARAAGGAQALVDRSGQKALERPVAFLTQRLSLPRWAAAAICTVVLVVGAQSSGQASCRGG